jgi:hypothetical protein
LAEWSCRALDPYGPTSFGSCLEKGRFVPDS